jgi:hypothetical protein
MNQWRPEEIVRDHVFIRLYAAQPGERYQIGITSQRSDVPTSQRFKVCEVRIP